MNEKLTAYVLNELPPDECAAFEAQMEKDPALRLQAGEMKTFCSLLNEQIARGGNDTLKPEQRSKLMEDFQSAHKIIRPFWRRPGFMSGIGLAAAACVATMLAVHKFYQPDSPHETGYTVNLKSGLNAQSKPVLNQDNTLQTGKDLGDLAARSNLPKVAPPPLAPDSLSTDQKQNMALFAASNDDLSGASGLARSGTIASAREMLRAEPTRDRQTEGLIALKETNARELSIDHLGKHEIGATDFDKSKTYTGSTAISGGMLQMNPSGSPAARTYYELSKNSENGRGDKVELAAATPPINASAQPQLERKMMADAVSTPAAPVPAEKPTDPPVAGTKMLAANDKKKEVFGRTQENSASAPAPSAPATVTKSSVASNHGYVGGLNTYSDSELGLGDKDSDPGFGGGKKPALAASGQVNGSGMGGGAGGGGGINKSGSGALASRASGDETFAEASNRDGRGERTPREEQEFREKSAGWQNKTRGTQTYRPIIENPFLYVAQQPLSTFSLDVDTASYANVRRMLNAHQRPPADAVRLEELINYFPYSYEPPTDDKPFAVHVDIAEAPWQPLHRLARVAVKGREIKGERQPANFVFLLDVSGSMQPDERLPLIKQSLRLLVDQLRADDRVAIVTYAGESGVALPATPGSEKEKITQAIDHLRAGGSTNGASGIRLAYEQAALNFCKERINRVILATDGDFNVGTSSVQELEKIIAEKAKSGVFLSVLGVGTDNLHDHTMQAIADRGNGNYHYLDSLGEARKVLVEQMTGTLVTIAKDVKVQIEFNPAQVAAYRLIGYEKRLLAKEDFNNDKKDAGEIGAGHTITALYEIVPASLKFPDGKPVVDDLKYAQKDREAAKPVLDVTNANTKTEGSVAESAIRNPQSAIIETMTVKLRYKQPDGDKSQLIEIPFTDNEKKLADSDKEFQFAVSVAGFGMLLRDSQHTGELTWELVRQLALSGKGPDEQGWRGEFIQLIEKARGLTESK